ncbi:MULTISPECIES: TetR/AcrR family transcriptional regulator [Streptomyces]|jgi:AcrR family transcriptional regulator|uniref:TetR/AcrR family transcriptional regulator n=1 Tax=Streptomyces doudnae TaxID=3075536 RepID=A0ABD5EFS8_9ACTN|nr:MULTISPECIES: TetR/AcrR family transcriptional regulator [unclassified Streptomyces]MDT0433531.1 TetR/AcrR family transcriptional regulator [Streptomyces sp. DSM 41981]MYQ64930.1 TetR family transcriptional regulator [Streptomyces sp. SID4950]SCD89226.1 transcriptional regulator, TetR family [Streptomyces sp. SolWspMP-5a-2]
MASMSEQPPHTPAEEPAWKRRAVERSTQAAKRRAEERGERFLDAARAVVTEKGTTDFTVQEVVDRSRQSLRSFYQHFDGKHELLLALFEDAMATTAGRLRAAAARESGPLERLRCVVRELFESGRPGAVGARRPLFADFAPALLVSRPREMAVAVAPVVAVVAELTAELERTGALGGSVDALRAARLTVRTVLFAARPESADEGEPLTADEVWDFCAHGLLRG